jgi:hypothetical protein
MAEVIHIRQILEARRRRQEEDCLGRCVELIRRSLGRQVAEFGSAPAVERPVRAARIRKLGELLEYATSLL